MRHDLQMMARTGDQSAVELLEAEPPPPESLEYVLAWFDQLASRRTMGPHGPNGFTDEMIRAWAMNQETDPRPHEVEWLFMLDVVMRYPTTRQRLDEED